MKCWKSEFNAQGSRLIIVALQVGAEALKKKEKTGWNSVHHKNWGPPHPWMLMFFKFFESHPIFDQTQGSSVVSLTL
jgi:hypothetical protein